MGRSLAPHPNQQKINNKTMNKEEKATVDLSDLYLNLLAAWGDEPLDKEAVLNILKESSMCGVSQWKNHGIRYGYDKYFGINWNI